MLIKHAALTGHLARPLSPLYVLVGLDPYLLHDAAMAIKTAWLKQGASEEKRITLNQAADWTHLLEEANSYSLFFDTVFIDANFDKKTLDAAGKKALLSYLESLNTDCLMMIRAPLVSPKQLQWLTTSHHATVVHITPLSPQAMLNWISHQLNQSGLIFTQDIPELILQYTQGNHLACAQVLEKLALVHAAGESITPDDVRVHLTHQCDYQLFELADACLAGNTSKAILLLRQASENRTEVTLILWLLTQEIRLLIQLSTKLEQGMQLNTACNNLKIWPQRIRNYEMTLKRLPKTQLHTLLRMSQQLDEGMKTGLNKHIWQGVEQLALLLTHA